MQTRSFVLVTLAAAIMGSGCQDPAGPAGLEASFTRVALDTPEKLAAWPEGVAIDGRDRITVLATAWHGCTEPVLHARRYHQVIEVELAVVPSRENTYCRDLLVRLPVQIEIRVPEEGAYVVRATIVGQPAPVEAVVTVNPNWR